MTILETRYMLASEIGTTYMTLLPSMPLMQHLRPNTKSQ